MAERKGAAGGMTVLQPLFVATPSSSLEAQTRFSGSPETLPSIQTTEVKRLTRFSAMSFVVDEFAQGFPATGRSARRAIAPKSAAVTNTFHDEALLAWCRMQQELKLDTRHISAARAHFAEEDGTVSISSVDAALATSFESFAIVI